MRSKTITFTLKLESSNALDSDIFASLVNQLSNSLLVKSSSISNRKVRRFNSFTFMEY